MRIVWYGHSCFLLEIADLRLVFDPFLKGNPLAPIAPADVKCDFVLCSHAHEDHLGDTVEIARANNAKVIAPYELARYLEAQGLKVVDLMQGGGAQLPFGRVKLTPAIHSSALELPGGANLPMGNPAGFLITTAEGRSVYHSGDTALFSDMQLIGRHGLDLALLPIGDRYTMGIEDAVLALDFLKPKIAVPMHYNTSEEIRADPQLFFRQAALSGHTVRILVPGEVWEF